MLRVPTTRSPLLHTAGLLLAGLSLTLGAPVAAQDSGTGEVAEATARQISDQTVREWLADGQAAWGAQNWASSAEIFAKITEARPQNGMAWHRLGYALHAQGKLDEALKAHVAGSALPGSGALCAYNAACVHALQGRTDDAFTWLDKARSKGFADVGQLTGDTDLVSLREDPRFAKLAKELKEKPPQMQAFVNATPRQSARLMFWNQSGSPGQVMIDHGVPQWNDKMDAAVKSGKFDDTRWRLGADFWTTLDTNLDLEIAGVSVPAGSYYLTLEKRSKDGAFVLALLDPAKVRAAKLDAYLAQYSQGGTEVTLTHEHVEETASSLAFALNTDAKDLTNASLAIHFGPHRLRAPIKIRF